MSMLYDRLMCINYEMCDGYYHKIIHENIPTFNVNINTTLKRNVSNREVHA